MTDINKAIRDALRDEVCGLAFYTVNEEGDFVPLNWDGTPDSYFDSGVAKIKALVVEALPKEHECTKDCNINSNEWRRGHQAYKDGLKAGLGEIRSIYGK
jgi:hypothetical protein